jgi:hypothetical protein
MTTVQQYYADDVIEGAPPLLSASIAKILVNQSPAHAYLAHPKLGGRPNRPSPSMNNGTLHHAMLFDGWDGIDVIQANDYRTKAAQEARDASRAAGRVPVLDKEVEQLHVAKLAHFNQLKALGLTPTGGQAGEIVTWKEVAADGTPVRCKAMLDYSWVNRFLEWKTIKAADPDSCVRAAWKLGYDIQTYAYIRSLESKPNPVRPMESMAGRIGCAIAFAEIEPPYAVTAFKPSASFIESGRRRWERAVNLWAACLKSGNWPNYQQLEGGKLGVLDLPSYAIAELGLYDEDEPNENV